MKNCTRCGAQTEDSASFCSKCGNSFTSQNYVPAYQPTKDNVPLYIGLAVIALIAVSVVAGAIVVSNAINNMPWNEFGDYNTDMTVQNCSTYTSADLPAPTGQKYVMVTAFIHSDRQGTLPLSPAYFLLMTAQGGIYAYSALVPNSVPASIASGSGASVSVGFLIPEDATPVDLRLMLVEDWGGHVDAAIL